MCTWSSFASTPRPSLLAVVLGGLLLACGGGGEVAAELASVEATPPAGNAGAPPATTPPPEAPPPEAVASPSPPAGVNEAGIGLEILEVRLLSPSSPSHQRMDYTAAAPRPVSWSANQTQLLLTIEITNLSGAVIDSCAPPVGLSLDVALLGSRGEWSSGLSESWWADTWRRSLYRPDLGGSERWTRFNPCHASLAQRVWRPGDRRRFLLPYWPVGRDVVPELAIESVQASLRMGFLGLTEASGRRARAAQDGSLLYMPRTGGASASIELPADLLTARLVDLDGGRGAGLLVGDRLLWNGPSGPASGYAAWSGPFAAPPSRPVPAEPLLPSTSEDAWSMRITAIDLVPWAEVPRLHRDRKLVRVSATLALDPARIEALALAGLTPERVADPEAVARARASARSAALRAFDCSALSVLTERRRVRARNASAARTACATLSAADRVEVVWEMELERHELPLALVYDVRGVSGTRHAYDLIASGRLFARDPR